MHRMWAFLAAALLWIAAAPPTQAAWLRAESQNFIVFSESSEGRLRQQVEILEDYDALLRRLTATDAPNSPNKLRVYIVRSTDELRQVRDVPAGIGGFYSSGSEGIAAFVNANAGGDLVGANEVLFHEYAHHFMMQYHGTAYPPWYVEGFAEFMSTARFTERHVEFGQPSPGRALSLAQRHAWLPMEEILFARTRTDREGQARFYAQSWLLTHYLLSDPARVAQFRAYLAALGRSEDPRAAFQASFAVTPAQMQRQLTDYAFGRITYRRMDRASIARAPQVGIVRLPASAEDLLLLQAAMHIGSRDGPALIERIRRAAARHDDPFARRVLAQAEALYGDGAVADRLLEALLAASPNDAELLYLRGMRHIVAAREAEAEERSEHFRAARTWLSRAHRIDANHFQTLYRYAQSFSDEPDFVSENNVNILLLAQSLAPQVAEIRMTAASMLLAMRDFELAETLLRPLTGTAHEGPLAAAARTMIEQARARTVGPGAVAFDPGADGSDGDDASR